VLTVTLQTAYFVLVFRLGVAVINFVAQTAPEEKIARVKIWRMCWTDTAADDSEQSLRTQVQCGQ
jgi:hypothetical protein